MKRYKISWRMGLDDAADPETFSQYLDLLTEGGQAGDELWIFISEPSSNGYEPLGEVARKCGIYRQAAAAAKARGLRVGINPWPTFGADDDDGIVRGQPELPYQGMVGMDGRVSRRVACPVSPEFLEYSRERYRLFAKTGCDFAWVDDDCRFTHLGGVPFPCFCPRCVAGFENGRFRDRESLVAALNAPENGELRRAWSAYGAQRLAIFCANVRKAVDEIDPEIGTPFMSVGFSHTTFAGDYIEKCMTALRAKAARPGHGFYWDETPMDMFDKVYEMSRQVNHMIPSVLDDVQYEEESHPRTPLNKAPGTRLMEMALSVWGGCTGVAMNHMNLAGGPRPFDYLRYETGLLRRCRGFFDRYLDFAHDLPQSGIWAAYSQWAMSGRKVGPDGWFDNREQSEAYNANRFVREWPVFGVPVTADPSHAYATLLQGRLPEVFSDRELSEMLKKPLFLDGEALEVLWERGFGEQTGVRILGAEKGGAEKTASSPYAGEFAGAMRYGLFGKNYALEPLNGEVEVLAHTARPYGIPDEISATRYGGIVVLGYSPYRFTGTVARQKLMRELEKSLGAQVWLEPVDDYDPPRVAVFARADTARAAVLLINAETSPARSFDVCFRGEAGHASVLGFTKAEAALPVRRQAGSAAVRIEAMAPWETLLVLFEP